MKTLEMKHDRVCPACDGAGASYGTRYCRSCHGRGMVTETLTMTVESGGDA